jgi:flavin-dependent dehydrogenase
VEEWDCIIVGGGVAGLSAGIRLTELNKRTLILEGSKYPGHRMCGEFFSPEALPILKNWDIIPPVTITAGRFIFGKNQVDFSLPTPAGGFSRYDFDVNLMELAVKKGVTVLTESPVTDLALKKPFHVTCHGKIFNSSSLIIGSGRLPQFTPLAPKYMGFKAHFEGIDLDSTLEMHCFKGGYVGLSPLSPNTVNVACLVDLKEVKDPQSFMKELKEKKGMEKFKKRIAQGKMVFPDWLTGKVPEFGIRKVPEVPHVFFIGDAAGSIPPICGDGLAIALTSGVMAANYCASSNALSFKRDWRKTYSSRFFWAKLLHKITINPTLGSCGASLCQFFPTLPQKLFHLTRG